jgi:hypothetical protein
MKPLSYDLEEVNKLFTEKKILDLRGISNRLVREAALTNDYGKAELGVIAYALHKIETKPHFTRNQKWNELKQVITQHLNEAENAAREEDQKKFLGSLKTVIQGIVNIDNELGNFAQNIYDKAKVKQASLAYSYGLSIAQSAALTGADQKELQSYIGFTTMHDEEPEAKNITQRVKELKQLLEAQ